MPSDSSSDDEFYDCYSEPVKYYAVPCLKDKSEGYVTTDLNEMRKKFRSSKSVRFSSFSDPVKAKRFSETPVLDDIEKKKGPKKQPEPFPSISAKDLTGLKALIESGDADAIRKLIWSNPKYLVTESDSPSLIYVRFRYNALHVATAADQSNVLSVLLEALDSDDLWMSLYPGSGDDCGTTRRLRVLDMHLNGPEAGCFETPLHFASKYGHAECLRQLLAHPMTDTSLRNRDGLTAEEVVCQRCRDPTRERQIRSIFKEKFVVLIEDDGRCTITIMDQRQLQNDIRQRKDGAQSNCGAVRAYAGPLEEARARQFRDRWMVPNADDAAKFELIRRTDAEKGMETHGRWLASQFGTAWHESWPFLGDFVDLASRDGLTQLQQYLETSFKGTSYEEEHSSQVVERSSGTLSGMYGSLVRLFSRLTLNSPPAPKTLPQQRNMSVIHNSSLRALRMPFHRSLIGGGILTPTDRHVRTVVMASNERDEFPAVVDWLTEMALADPTSELNVSMSNGSYCSPFVTSTPVRPQKKRLAAVPPPPRLSSPSNTFRSLSPLSRIELPD